MKPLLLAMLASCLLAGIQLNAQTNLKYYQYSKSKSFDVGVQPQFVFYDKTTQKAHVFCIGQDLNYDGIKDDVDYSPSWWTIDMANGDKTTKIQDFPFGSFNMFYFRPAVDTANRKIYIPSSNKVFGFGLDDLTLKDSIIAPSIIEGMTYGFGEFFLSVNPTYGAPGKVLVYKDGLLSKEIEVGVMAQNIAVYSNSKTQKAIAVVNIGNYGENSSVSFIEFAENDEYTKTDVEIGITANSIYSNAGYIYVVCNSTNNTYKINAENYQIEKILHSATTGWDGPRQMAFNNEYGFISDFSGDVRVMDLNEGIKEIIHVNGKIEGVAIVSNQSFLTAVQMNADYSSNNVIELFEKREYSFDEYSEHGNMYDFCQTCEKPQALVADEYGEIYVLCVGDSAKGILPTISKISTAWPCTLPGQTLSGKMNSQEIYKFNSYVFHNPPTMSITGNNILYVSTDENVKVFSLANGAKLVGEYDFPAAFYLKSGKYYEKDYFIALNKAGSITVIGDETNIAMSDKTLIDGVITNDFSSGDVSAAFIYNVDNKADLELIDKGNQEYLIALGNDGRIIADNNFRRIYYFNYTDVSSEIQSYDLPTMKLEKTFNSGLVSNKFSKPFFSPETIGVETGNNSETIVVPSELGDVRILESGLLTRIIPMPSGAKGYFGNDRYFYTLLPDMNLICMYGLVAGAVKDNDKNNEISFKLYPNPASSFTKIELSENIGKSKIEVVSITGEVVFSTEFYGTAANVNLNQLNIPAGYYNVVISSEGKKGIQPLIFIK
ncbi:MAG: T9SS type A sorting domain-containing protein [bacterium]